MTRTRERFGSSANKWMPRTQEHFGSSANRWTPHMQERFGFSESKLMPRITGRSRPRVILLRPCRTVNPKMGAAISISLQAGMIATVTITAIRTRIDPVKQYAMTA